MNTRTDLAIVGGGIVGLATAYQVLQTRPDVRITILEKENDIALHQTGRNSGVLHSGIYYKPGSLKANTCRKGKALMEAFCTHENIPFDLCGKVIVATSTEELPILDRIFSRGQQNGVRCRMIDAVELKEIEPHTAGIKAIHVPEAGIVDYTQVCHSLKARITGAGSTVRTCFEVKEITHSAEGFLLSSTEEEVNARFIINCSGLFADRVAALTGATPSIKIVPFRGEYFVLKPEAEHLCNGLIYPVPDPDFPFLGVHFTRMIQGGVECGPNAVLAFAREGYTRHTVQARDFLETLMYQGFQQLAVKHWKQGLSEMWRSFSKQAFVRALQHLVPDIRSHHLMPAPAGVRAQALNRDGSLVDDFMIIESDRVINVCNAPSPAATASLQIGKTIAEKLLNQLEAFNE